MKPMTNFVATFSFAARLRDDQLHVVILQCEVIFYSACQITSRLDIATLLPNVTEIHLMNS